MKRLFLAILTTTLIGGIAFAEDGADDRQKRELRRPPAAALEACESAVQGDPCSFEGRHGDPVEGSCEAPDDKPLACRPERTPDRAGA